MQGKSSVFLMDLVASLRLMNEVEERRVRAIFSVGEWNAGEWM